MDTPEWSPWPVGAIDGGAGSGQGSQDGQDEAPVHLPTGSSRTAQGRALWGPGPPTPRARGPLRVRVQALPVGGPPRDGPVESHTPEHLVTPLGAGLGCWLPFLVCHGPLATEASACHGADTQTCFPSTRRKSEPFTTA